MRWLQLVTCAIFAQAFSTPTSPLRSRLRELVAAGTGGRVLAWLRSTGLIAVLLGSLVIALQGAFNLTAVPWWLQVVLVGSSVAAFILYGLLYPFLMEWRRSPGP